VAVRLKLYLFNNCIKKNKNKNSVQQDTLKMILRPYNHASTDQSQPKPYYSSQYS